MSAKLGSRISVCVAFALLEVVLYANGCGGSGSGADSGTGGSAGSGGAAGAAGSAGSGGTAGVGGAAGSGGAGGSGGTGGAAETAGSGGSGGSGGTIADSGSACTCPVTGADSGVLYVGGSATGTCPSAFTFNGVSNSWFAYNDGTVDAGLSTHTAETGGCDGPNTCAFHA